MTNSISIVKGVDSIVALIGNISTKQGDYRNGVSSAVLSAVAHSMEHNETDMIGKLLNTMFTDAYRDLKVVATFINSVTPVMLEEVKDGRRTRYVVKACQFISGNYEKEGKSQKELGELKVKALKAHNSRAQSFEEFCKEDGEIRVRNLDWKEGDAKDTKTVGFKCHRNVFNWFEEIEYVRKEAAKGKDANAIDGFKLLEKDAYESMIDYGAKMLKALESFEGEARTDQVKADIKVLHDIQTRVAAHVKQRIAERQALVEAATLEAAGATKKMIADWFKIRADRVSGGTEAEAIATEFEQTVNRIKEKVAAKAAKEASANKEAA